MHYSDGTPAKLGDIAKGDYYGREVCGRIIATRADSTTCNLDLAEQRVLDVEELRAYPGAEVRVLHGPTGEPVRVLINEVRCMTASLCSLVYRAPEPAASNEAPAAS